jgi:hypothetical protein
MLYSWGEAGGHRGSGSVATVAVAGWQCGGAAGEKMEEIGCVLREIRVFVAAAVVGGWIGSGRVAVRQCGSG